MHREASGRDVSSRIFQRIRRGTFMSISSREVIDEDGRHYAFEGVAMRRPSGRFDVRTLRLGEWIVRPGLLYRQIE